MSTVVSALCECSSWDPQVDADRVRFCEVHHVYKRGAQELVSVTRVLKSVWPVKPDFSKADPDVLENARVRGVQVDQLFTQWLRGHLAAIPAGTREDAKELFKKLTDWWRENVTHPAHAQVILAGKAVAGMCDVITHEPIIRDLKTTYDIEPMYPVQLGAYGDLYEEMYGCPPEGLEIIHLTKRFAKPQVVKLDVAECVRDWRLVKDTYQMALRRSA